MLKVLYYGQNKNIIKHQSEKLLYNLLSTNNIKIDELDNLTDIDLCEYNIIITNYDDIHLFYNHHNKVISYIDKPNNSVSNNILLYGNIGDSCNSVKLPNYINYIDSDIINIANNYVENITFDDFINKRYATLISNHDNGNTKTLLYNKLSEISNIVCPLNLFNNFPSNEYNNDVKRFTQEFIFNICVESYSTHIEGCISNKLLNAVLSGNIPIYFGNMDKIDSLIFNMDRIILCDVNNPESINNTFNIVKDLLYNPQKIYKYYTQPVFNYNAINVINDIKINFVNKINEFINNNVIYGTIYKDSNNDIMVSNNDSNIIISLSTTMETLHSESFQNTITLLLNQKLKPKFIIIKIDTKEESYIIHNNNYPSLIVHCYNCDKYKNYNIDNLLLLSSQLNILDNDKIIFINDKFIPKDDFTLLYELCYQLYNSHGVVVNNDDSMCLFSDIYYNINENYSYSLKFKYIKNMIFEDNQISSCNNLMKELYITSIHILLGNISSKDSNNHIHHNINNVDIDNIIYPRTLLYNLDDISQIYNNNKHLDLKYYNKNTILITITYFDMIPITDIITIKIHNYNYNINITNNNSHKQSYLLSLNLNINYITNNDNDIVNIIQCDENHHMNLAKFYSINTILNYIPHMTYKFFNTNDIYEYISQDKNILKLYNKVNSIKIKTNLFKLYYLYNNGGLYINCKSILYNPLNLLNNIFVKDIHDNYLSNIFYYINSKYNDIIGKSLVNISNYIYNMSYDESIYNMSSIKLDINTLYFHSCDNNWKDSVIKYKDNIIIKSSYYNYNEHINEEYLWKYKKLYKYC